MKILVSRLRSKIERPGGLHYIETERGVGYGFMHPDDWCPVATAPAPAANVLTGDAPTDARALVLVSR